MLKYDYLKQRRSNQPTLVSWDEALIELSLGFSEGVKYLIEHSPTGYFLLVLGGELWIKSWVVGHRLYKIRCYRRRY